MRPVVSELAPEVRRTIMQLHGRLTAIEERLDGLEAVDWVGYAESQVLGDYGDVVSVAQKRKSLTKFGSNSAVGTSLVTVWDTGGNETYCTDNLIDRVVSSSGSDTVQVTIEGHTISGGVFTFVVQTATLNGTTPVTLATPLARASRAYNIGATDLVGDITVYESIATTVHLTLKGSAGFNQSNKAATTLSNTDYMFITSFTGEIRDKTAGTAELALEIREAGSVFRRKSDITVSSNGSTTFTQEFRPYLIVKKNSDIRIRAIADGASTSVGASWNSVLAKVI